MLLFFCSGMFGFFDCTFSTFNCVCWVASNTTRYPMKSNIQTQMLTFSCHAKTVSHITHVDLHSTSATQQLRDCTGFRSRIIYTVSQKNYIPWCLTMTLANMDQFSNFFSLGDSWEILYVHTQRFPPHMQYFATLLCEIRKSKKVAKFSRWTSSSSYPVLVFMVLRLSRTPG